MGPLSSKVNNDEDLEVIKTNNTAVDSSQNLGNVPGNNRKTK